MYAGSIMRVSVVGAIGAVVVAVIIGYAGYNGSHNNATVRASMNSSQAEAPTGHTQFRGVMSPTSFHAEDFDDLRKLNVNIVRWQVKGSLKDLTGTNDWATPLLDSLALALDAAQKNDIKIVVVLMWPPGGLEADHTLLMFEDQKYHDQFVELWKTIATRFKNNSALYGYDLLNEPTAFHKLAPGSHDWMQSQLDAANAIRKIDQKTPIIFEVDNSDAPGRFSTLQPVPVSNVIYEVHMYQPYVYTAQGLKSSGLAGLDVSHELTYPGRIGLRYFDRDTLRSILQPIRDFQLAHHARIYVGEFSAIRWAPGADKWLDDVSSILEDWGWDYTYHAFREWEGWDLEMPDSHSMTKTASPGAREQVMLKRFALNKRASN